MARVSLIGPETASQEVRHIYGSTLRGQPGSMHKALAHRPEMLKNFLAFYASVGRSLGPNRTNPFTWASIAQSPIARLNP
jgi:hypothetical protein